MNNIKKQNLHIKNKIDEDDFDKLNFKSVAESLFLNIKILAHSSIFLWLFLILPVILVFSTSVIFPFYTSFTLLSSTLLLFSGSLVFSALYFGFKKSTLKENISLSSHGIKSTLFSIPLTMLIATFLSYACTIILLIITVETGISSYSYSFRPLLVNPSMIWKDVWWGAVAYYWFMYTVVIYFIFVFFEKHSRSKKTFMVMTFTYILFSLIFGGTISNTWTFIDGKFVFIQEGTPEAGTFSSIEPYFYGNPLWRIGQILPTYQLNQFVYNSLIPGLDVSQLPIDNGVNSAIILAHDNLTSVSTIYHHQRSAAWSYIIAMPYIWCLILYILTKTKK